MSLAIKNLYDTLKTNCLAIQDALLQPVVNHFSFYNQNKADENFQAIGRNVAIFLELEDIGWRERNKAKTDRENEQIGICNFRLHVFRKSLKNDNDATLELLQIADTVHRVVIESYSTNFNLIRRIGNVQDSSHDNVIDLQITYTCQLYEQATTIVRAVVSDAGLVIETEVNNVYNN